MGMMSEIATEHVIKALLGHIDREMKDRPHPEAQMALKAIARKALCEFEWDTPQWAKDRAEQYNA